ncbi:DUF2513 domain-containing protein [Burkholderia vietnamiensis]|uniref:DUF2513 domain-containing protein n=1 Tax=Burkholderia vietnamiensis TaxID=60552 RepID=UPI0007598575|nr:DUF2513 domain-containing protein [Burkholderia vietnamiensis]KVR84404.1 hypothetical protein WK27_18670 [Burkholderia vietnamiensis]MCA8073553.1 DUF2513 domain-containing protein [Burkholderia vietnamiensis]
MKRDLDLIRELMLKLEALPVPLTEFKVIDGNAAAVQVEGYSAEQIDYHLLLLEQAGFIHGGGLENFGMRFGPGIGFQSLTWAGHDFLDTMRSPDVWDRTKQAASAAGGFTVELLMFAAKSYLQTRLKGLIGG